MAKASRYSPHPVMRMAEAYHRGLKERTGKTFEQWVTLAKKKGPPDRAGRVAWLKKEHGLTTNYAWWVASGDDGTREDPTALVDALYAGDRAALRSVHERLVDVGLALGKDVKACPCQTMVPLYRKFSFAEIRPATKKIVDLGLALGDTPAKGRLESLGSRAVGNRITHRIRISVPSDIDSEVKGWLAKAYERGSEQQDRGKAAAKGKAAKVPVDLARGLKSSAKARATFDECTPRMQADWIEWIEGAAKPETRARRLATTLERLSAGKKRAY